MTSLAANVASLATCLGAVTGDVARLVAVIAALHRKAAGIVATLRAAARHVTSLVAIVTTQLRSLSKTALIGAFVSPCGSALFESAWREKRYDCFYLIHRAGSKRAEPQGKTNAPNHSNLPPLPHACVRATPILLTC